MLPVTLTIVICTHNRVDLLMHAISSLNAARQPQNCKLSILVIANACKYQSTTELQRYMAQHKDGKKIALQNFAPGLFLSSPA